MLKVLDKRSLRAKGVPYSNVHLLRLERADKFPRASISVTIASLGSKRTSIAGSESV